MRRRILLAILSRLFARLPLFIIRTKKLLSSNTEFPRVPRSILIVRLDAMGDLILTTPLFRDLKQNFPQVHITVITHQAFQSVLAGNPFVDKVLTLPAVKKASYSTDARLLGEALKLSTTVLRKEHYDYAISPRWDADAHPANLLCLLAPATKTVGFSDRSRVRYDFPIRKLGEMFDLTVPDEGLMHEVLRAHSLITALGGAPSNFGPEIFPGDEQVNKAADLLREAPPEAWKIAVGIGAQDAFRRWPLERYAQVIEKLAANRSVFAVILCGPSEVEDGARFAKMLNVPTRIIADKDLRTVASVLTRCSVFIGNDSGPSHLAAASGCPVVVISPHPMMGEPTHPNSPTRFSPYCRQSVVLRPETARDPCKTSCSEDYPHCILEVSSDEVVASVRTLLDNSPSVAALYAGDRTRV